MEIKEISIKDLRRADYNPREKTEHILETVRQSIKEYGFLQPVVVNTHQNLYTFYRGDHSLLRNPQLLEVHHKVLGFLRGDPEKIKDDFKNPPPIKRDIIGILTDEE